MNHDEPFLRIGTRGSPLALAQAHEVAHRLSIAHDVSVENIAIHVIKTTGDIIRDRPLSEIGGKGLFTKEIEEALLEGSIDIAVHSAKDMPTELPQGLELCCWLPREDVRDGFISFRSPTLETLPEGAVVGTASLRRQAMVLHYRPDLRVATLRGNVETRLKKLEDGEVDATLLAISGLNRLGKSDHANVILDTAIFLPAVGQGAITIEARLDDEDTRQKLALINDPITETCLLAERELLAGLDGSCRTPIGGLAEITDNQLRLRGTILRPDGSKKLFEEMTGALEDAQLMGRTMADKLRQQGGKSYFE